MSGAPSGGSSRKRPLSSGFMFAESARKLRKKLPSAADPLVRVTSNVGNYSVKQSELNIILVTIVRSCMRCW